MLKLSITILSLALFANMAFAADGLLPCKGLDCSICDLGTVFNTLITYAVQFAFLAAIVATFAGGAFIMFSGGNDNKLKQGKGIIWAAAIGLAIVLSAWILIDTLFKVTVGENPTFGPWNQLRCPALLQNNTKLAPTGAARPLAPDFLPIQKGRTQRLDLQPRVSDEYPL